MDHFFIKEMLYAYIVELTTLMVIYLIYCHVSHICL